MRSLVAGVVVGGCLAAGGAVAAPGAAAERPSAAASPRGAALATDGDGDAKATTASCLAELAQRGVPFRRTAQRGIAIAVEITGPIGGLAYRYHQPLVIDCSLAVSLDEAGHYLRELGVRVVSVASAYSRRNVRGTNRPSKHSYGLAIDLPGFEIPELGKLRIDHDYEQGLGDDVDCIGAPMTTAGELLKIAQCQLVRSGLFFLVLSPDYDDAHHDHFHLEALPWAQRAQLRSGTAAIH